MVPVPKLKKAWLYLPSQWTYFLSPWALKLYSSVLSSPIKNWKPLHWKGLYFPNPLGTAGGLDKNAKHIKEYWSLGAGFLEIGTVTPEPQSANSGKILDRSLEHLSLWNNMGFPNKGLAFVEKQLELIFKEYESLPTPLFISLGKNRNTDQKSALLDYKKGMEALYKYASAFVINISSPNTPSLRDIFDKDHLPDFLKSLQEIRQGLNKNIPLILKLSPDEQDLIRIVEQSLLAGIDGFCLCNSTKQRPVKHIFPEEKGGISGKLLAPLSLNLLKQLTDYFKKNQVQDKLIISSGGVLTAQDVSERLDEGAHLVQVYSALVFQGFGFFQSVPKELSK